MIRRNWSQGQVDLLNKAIKEQIYTTYELAEIIGKDREAIKSALRGMGIKYKPKNSGKVEWTAEDILWLKNNYKNYKIKIMCGILNRSYGSIWRQLFLNGLIGSTDMTEDQEKSICDLYLIHKNRTAVAKMSKITLDIMDRILIKYNIGIQFNSLFKDNQESIISDYNAGILSMLEIGKKYGFGSDEINRNLKLMGIYNPKRKNKFAKRKPIYEGWEQKYGKEATAEKIKLNRQKHSDHSRGEKNPMYNVPTPQGAGNGWKGWFDGIYFRSLRELCFMVQTKDQGLECKTAETRRLIVPYEFMGRERTYRPDFIVGDTVYEIKPTKMINTPNVLAKTNAAIPFLGNLGLKFVITDVELDQNLIKKYYDLGRIKFSHDYEQRFLNFIEKNQKLG